jgi:hypothetical protein
MIKRWAFQLFLAVWVSSLAMCQWVCPPHFSTLFLGIFHATWTQVLSWLSHVAALSPWMSSFMSKALAHIVLTRYIIFWHFSCLPFTLTLQPTCVWFCVWCEVGTHFYSPSLTENSLCPHHSSQVKHLRLGAVCDSLCSNTGPLVHSRGYTQSSNSCSSVMALLAWYREASLSVCLKMVLANLCMSI